MTLNLALRSEAQEIATARIEDLPGGGHLAKFINELFLDTNTDDFEGTLVVQAIGGKVAATALELGPQAGQFTTLPVISSENGTNEITDAHKLQSYGKLPLHFEVNRGQIDNNVKFLARGLSSTLHFTSSEVIIAFKDCQSKACTDTRSSGDGFLRPTESETASGSGRGAFVTKIDATGSGLTYSTFLNAKTNAIALDPTGAVYVTGLTQPNFPTTPGAFQMTQTVRAPQTAFVTKISEGKKLYLAQFGNGQGFVSDTVLTNHSTETVSGRIDFFGDDGLPLPVGLAASGDEGNLLLTGALTSKAASSVDFSIAPLDAKTFSSDGQGDLLAGSVLVSADNNLGGVVRFGIPDVGIAGVGQSQPVSGFIVSVRREVGGINTGIAIQNTGGQPLTLNLTVRTPGGGEVATKTIENFPGGGHLARFIYELFPSRDFEGTLIVETRRGKISATALELGPKPGEFTTLPVTPLK